MLELKKEIQLMIKIYFGMFHTLGDVIACTSITRALKVKYPDSEIYFATSKDYVGVLEENPDIKEAIACGSPAEVVLRGSNGSWDRVFLPLQLTQEDSVWHQTPPWCLEGENHNLVDFYASRCMDDIKITDRRTFIFPQDRHWAEIISNVPEEFREQFQTTPYITIHTTSRNESKDWNFDSFVELTRKIKTKYGEKFHIYQIGGKDDKLLPKPVVPLIGVPILNTAAIIKRSKYHIDIDSGTSFIADSLDVPMMVIYGCTTKNTSGPISNRFNYIEPSRTCVGTVRHTACHSHCSQVKPDCFSLSVQEVWDKVEQDLDGIFNGPA